MIQIDRMRAKKIYDLLCEVTDTGRPWYRADPDQMKISSTELVGKVWFINYIINLDSKNQLVRFIARLHIKFDTNRRVDGAMAVSIINNILADGNFDYNYSTGEVFFRNTLLFRDSVISKQLLKNFFATALHTIECHVIKLYKISKGLINYDEIIDA